MRGLLALCMICLATSAHCKEAFGPPTLKQQVLADLAANAVGVWSLVTTQFNFRVPRAELDRASDKCFALPAISPGLARNLRSAAASNPEGAALTGYEMRGDLVYRKEGAELIRIDYLRQNRAALSRWVKSQNGRGQDIYAIEAGGARFALFFDDFGVAPKDSGFMVQDSALFLKCPAPATSG